MKNSLNYLKLWQQKRSELPVNDSAQTDWLQMQNLLDLHLPSAAPHDIPQSDKVLKASKIIKAAKGFKALVLLVSTTATFVTGVYTYSHFHKIKHSEPDNGIKKHIAHVIADSLKTIDSLNQADSTTYGVNNPPQIKSTPANADSLANNNMPDSGLTGKNVPVNKNTGIKANTGNSVSNKNSGPYGILKGGKNTGTYTLANSQNTMVNQPDQHGHAANSAQTLYTGNRQPLGGTMPTSTPNGLTQGNSNYKPSVLSVTFQKSYSKVSGIDSIQSDVNNYFTKPAINKILNSSAKGNNGMLKQTSARVNEIVGKITKSSPDLLKLKAGQKPKNGKQEKVVKAKLSAPFNFDWGLLAGVNASGSFTTQKQNSNFYGSLPVDLNFGLYGTYHFNDRWAINVQAKALNPQKISGSYTHANGAKADSGAVDSGKTIRVTDSRKAYFVSVPIQLVYKLNNYLGLKAGSVINIPVKQITGTTSFTPLAIKTDTPYYTSVNNQLKNTRYVPAINVGVSAGVSLQYNRFSFEATYLKSISGFKVSSDFGSYKSNPGTVQLTVGFQLNKPPKK